MRTRRQALRDRGAAIRADRARQVRLRTEPAEALTSSEITAAIYFLQSLRDQGDAPRIRALVAEQQRRGDA